MKAPFQVHWQAPFPANVCGSGCKALRRLMQSFAWAIAKLCVGGCNALRWRLQCFALVDAMLCVGGCNALPTSNEPLYSDMQSLGCIVRQACMPLDEAFCHKSFK